MIWSLLSKTWPTMASGLQGCQSFRQWYYANLSHGHDLVRKASRHLFPKWLAWWDTAMVKIAAKNFIESLFFSPHISSEYLWIFGFGLAESCRSACATWNLKHHKISEVSQVMLRVMRMCWDCRWLERAHGSVVLAPGTGGWALPV